MFFFFALWDVHCCGCWEALEELADYGRKRVLLAGLGKLPGWTDEEKYSLNFEMGGAGKVWRWIADLEIRAS